MREISVRGLRVEHYKALTSLQLLSLRNSSPSTLLAQKAQTAPGLKFVACFLCSCSLVVSIMDWKISLEL